MEVGKGYIFFVISFALGFYILLHQSKPEDVNPQFPFFDDIWLSFVKTIGMYTGEHELSNLPYETKETKFGYIFSLLFILLLAMVMANLLNGLAVSDIANLRKEADIWTAKTDIEIIHNLVSSTVNIVIQI